MASNSSTSNSKKLPLAAIVTVLAALLFEVFNQTFDDRMYPAPYDGLNIKFKNQISQTHETNYDVLVLGDCLNFVGVDPQIIEQTTGLKTFNYATFLRHSIMSSYIFLKNHLEHNTKKPKFIIMNYIPELTFVSKATFYKQNLPFMFEMKEGNFLILAREIGFSEAVQLQLFSLKNRDYFLKGNFKDGLASLKDLQEFKKEALKDQGYYRRYGENTYKDYYAPLNMIYQYYPSEFFQKYLRKILTLAKQNNIIVLYPMITAPQDVYDNMYGGSHMIEIYFSFLMKMKKDYPNLHFWGWQNQFSKPEIYRDSVHLNRKGAELMSRKLSEVILKIQGKI